VERLITPVLLLALGWYAYSQYQRHQPSNSEAAQAVTLEEAPLGNFTCDGRTHCSQMTSCAEATYFLKKCPSTEMDGDDDGIPCEQQWCN
jgi:hypothetical protein